MDYGNNNACHYILSSVEFNMSDLENGDSPKQMELFDDGDNEMNWDKEVEELAERFNPGLSDIFNPSKMKEALDKANGQKNK